MIYYRIMINSFSKDMVFNEINTNEYIPAHENIGIGGFIKSFSNKNEAINTAIYYAEQGFYFPDLKNICWYGGD